MPVRTVAVVAPVGVARRIGGAVVCEGVLAYFAFLVADLVAQRIAGLAHALATLPEPTGLSASTIAVAAVNGIAEEEDEDEEEESTNVMN